MGCVNAPWVFPRVGATLVRRTVGVLYPCPVCGLDVEFDCNSRYADVLRESGVIATCPECGEPVHLYAYDEMEA